MFNHQTSFILLESILGCLCALLSSLPGPHDHEFSPSPNINSWSLMGHFTWCPLALAQLMRGKVELAGLQFEVLTKQKIITSVSQ